MAEENISQEFRNCQTTVTIKQKWIHCIKFCRVYEAYKNINSSSWLSYNLVWCYFLIERFLVRCYHWHLLWNEFTKIGKQTQQSTKENWKNWLNSVQKILILISMGLHMHRTTE